MITDDTTADAVLNQRQYLQRFSNKGIYLYIYIYIYIKVPKNKDIYI